MNTQKTSATLKKSLLLRSEQRYSFVNLIGKKTERDHTQDHFNVLSLSPVANKRRNSGQVSFSYPAVYIV